MADGFSAGLPPDPVFELFADSSLTKIQDITSADQRSTQSQCVEQLTIFLRLLSCSNVEVVESHPSTRRSSKKKDPNRTIYRELKIEPVSRRSGAQRIDNEDGSGVAFHLRRGHFADYTKGRGLFGKHKVRVWVPGHAVGDRDFGTVNKCYSIKREES